jgi:hypothetical protein
MLACVALGACRQQNRPPTDDRVPVAALRLLPEQARFIVAMDVPKIRDAAISKLGALGSFGPLWIDAFTTQTGVDPQYTGCSVVLGGVS